MSRRGTPGESGSYATFVPMVDLPILATLPDEGTMLGTYKPLAITAKAIGGRLHGELTGAEINGRLRSLKTLGLVTSVAVLPLGTWGWQITTAGKARLQEETS